MKTLDYALKYLERGWSVFPLQPTTVGVRNSGKRPLIDWSEYTKRLPTKKEIHKWWTETPDANIAVVCGKVSRLVAVDIDPDKGGTDEGQEYTNLRSMTGSGGVHLLYRYLPSFKKVPNRVGKDGVDVRGDGGYIVAPPSLHWTGKTYAWEDFGEPSSCPVWVLEKPTKNRKEESDKWVTGLIEEGTEVGRRNDDVARLAGYLAKKEIPPDIAEALVTNWMSHQDEPLPIHEIHTSVKSVYRTAAQSHKNGVNGQKFTGIGFSKYCLKYGTQNTKWLVDGWVPEGTIVFVVSPPGGRKTWVTFDLAISVATGKPFLGDSRVYSTGPVILVQQEDNHGDIVERLTTIELSKMNQDPPMGDKKTGVFDFPIPQDLPIVVHPDRMLRFDNQKVMDEFEALVADVKPKLAIIDPLYSAASTDDFMAKSAEHMLRLKKMRDEYGTSFVIVHHMKKSTETWDRQNLWGSQFLNAFMETGWQFRNLPDEESAIIVQRNFKSTKNPTRVRLDFDIETGVNFHFNIKSREATEEEVNKSVSRGGGGSSISPYRDALQNAGKATPAELAKTLGKSRSAVSRAMNKLKESGEASLDKGVWTYLEHPNF